MLSIRFFRTGKKNQPSFKIVVTKKTNSSTRGRFVEQVGTYNPTTKDKTLNVERTKYWLGVGAKPSDTVYNLLISEKVIDGKKIDLHKKSKKEAKKEEVPVVAKVPAVESVKEEHPVVEEKPVEPEKPVEEALVDKPAEIVEEKKPEETPQEVKPEEKVEETLKTE